MNGMGDARGQATVEFSLVLSLVLAVILGLTQLALYAVETTAAKNAVALGGLVAASAVPGQPGTPATAAVDSAVETRARSALFGARVAQRAPVNGTCPALAPDDPVGVVYVCVAPLEGGHAADVTVRGWVPALVPPSFGLGSWRMGALPIDVHSYVKTLVFTA